MINFYKWRRYSTFPPLEKKKKKKRGIEVWATKKFKRDKITGRVDIIIVHLERIAKSSNWRHRTQKSKSLKSFGRNLPKNMFFFRSIDLIFNFCALFPKMRQSICTLPDILSFMKFFVTQIFFVELHLQGNSRMCKGIDR